MNRLRNSSISFGIVCFILAALIAFFSMSYLWRERALYAVAIGAFFLMGGYRFWPWRGHLLVATGGGLVVGVFVAIFMVAPFSG